jgi:hypothetical protein
LNNSFNQEVSDASILGEEIVSPHNVSGQRELEKVKFLKFGGSTDGELEEAWLENMAKFFALRDNTSNIKVCMGIFQLKGISLLGWKNLLPQLGMDVCEISCELFEDNFR